MWDMGLAFAPSLVRLSLRLASIGKQVRSDDSVGVRVRCGERAQLLPNIEILTRVQELQDELDVDHVGPGLLFLIPW